MEKVRASGHQMRLIIISSITVTGHLLFVPVVFNIAGRDSWLSLPVAVAFGIIPALLIAALGKRLPGQSLMEICCAFLGKPIGKVVGLIYFGYFILIPAITLKVLINFMSGVFMPRTPPLVFGLIFIFVCGYAVFMGLEVLLRVNEILLPLLIFAGILASGLVIHDKNFKLLLPVMEDGIAPVLKGSIPLIALMSEIIVIGMIQPAIKQTSELRKINIGAILITGALFIGPLTGPIAIFGEELASAQIYPTYEQIKYIKLAYLENLQSLAVILWLAGSFGKISLFYYASNLGTAQIFGLKNHRKLVLPIGLIILILAYFTFPNIPTIRQFLSDGYTYISIGLGIVFPLILLGIGSIRNYLTSGKKKK